MPHLDLPQILLWLAGLTAAGWACHRLTMRVLAWRGIELRRTRFGIALLFDTTDEDGTPVRLLNVGNTFQSAGYVDEALRCELVCEYQRTQARIVSELPRLREAAVIGGGGFSFPKWLVTHLAPVRVSTVEIDPAIVTLARERFGLAEVEASYAESGRFSVTCADGWEWLRAQGAGATGEEPHTAHGGAVGQGPDAPRGGTAGQEPGAAHAGCPAGTFDLIVNEAFTGRAPLGPLTTAEGARLVHEHLADGGSYLATLRFPLEGGDSASMYETVAAFGAEFSHVWLVPEFADTPRERGNNTLVASDCDLVAAGCAPLAGFEVRTG